MTRVQIQVQSSRKLRAVIGGSGGGRPNFAQGGGTQVKNLSKAVEKALEILKRQLKT